jgi:4-hydroxy-tetrahydrodipicolinate synthase
MDTAFVGGVIPPVVTPVDAEERVVDGALRQIVDHVIAGGVHGILSLGSNGEFFGLDPEQQHRTLSITVDQAAGRVPVYMGIGAIATRECIRLARLGEDEKARAVTILPPMFLSPNDEELYRHFTAVADATSLPVLLYNNPDRMRSGISAGLLERLADVPNIVGIKDSSGDLTLTAEFIRRTRAKGFKVLAGRDIMILGTLAYGGVGCVASTANVVPRLVVEIYDRFQAGDLPGALEAQFRLAPLRMAFNLGSFPVATKDCMRLLGFDVGEPILPNLRCSDADMDRLRKILGELGAARLA